MTATLRSHFNLSAHLRPTIGDQKISYVGVDHMGWMLCDGRQLSIADYGLLFGVIGYTFSPDLSGSSNFRLPDFSGMVPGMAGRPQFSNVANPTTYAIGQRTGEQEHTLTVAEMPTHNHGTQTDLSGAPPELYNLTSTDGSHHHTGTTDGAGWARTSVDVQGPTGVGNRAVAEDENNHVHTFTTDVSGAHAHYLSNTGGSNAHNNMQPTLFAGNMFIYSGKNVAAYFPYTWVGGVPAPDGTAPVSGKVLIF